jgi:hypothetical protein
MIAKRVLSEKKTSTAAGLVRYIIDAKGGVDPRSWKETADYIFDGALETNERGEKVGGVRVTNCVSDDPARATLAIQRTQLRNSRSKADKTYHLVFSFPPGEQPSLKVLNAIEDELCAAIGYADHQRISAVHIDKEHLHVHVAINKVHPTGFQNIEPFYDKRRLMKACERLEIQYGLERTSHGLEQDRSYDPGDAQGPEHQSEPEQRTDVRGGRFRRYLSQCYNIETGSRPEGPGSQLKGIEHQSMQETLAGYIAREIGGDLHKARSWSELHLIAAEHGLTIKLRGAGLVMGDKTLDLWTKASSADRAFSLASLIKKLGPFEQLEHHSEQLSGVKMKSRYQPRPLSRVPSSAALFAQYQRERRLRTERRSQGFTAIRLENAQFKEGLKQWTVKQRMILNITTRGLSKKLAQAMIRHQIDAARQSNRASIAIRRENLFKETTMPSWADWLLEQARRGGADALAILRERQSRQIQNADILSGNPSETAQQLVCMDLKPRIDSRGNVTYRAIDGGVIVDRGERIHAKSNSAATALMALEIASKKFDAQALIVEGSELFRRDVAELAGRYEYDVHFDDPTMEKIRLASRAQNKAGSSTTPDHLPRQPKAESEQAPARAVDAITAFIEKRNADRLRIGSIAFHRLWTPDDAGPVIYQGRREMSDGSEVVLLGLGNEVLVKPSSSRVIAKASHWRRGQRVEVDGRGRFVNLAQGRGGEIV